MKHLVVLITGILVSSSLVAGLPACEQAAAVRALSRAGVSARLVDVRTTTTHHLDRFFDFKQRVGVFADFDCANITDAINASLQHDELYTSMFSHMSWWNVLTRRAGDALLALRSVPLTLNSQLLLIVKGKGSWYAYDVHTMDYRKSSPLNVTFYGIYADNDDDILETAQRNISKYLPPLLLEGERIYTAEEIQQTYEELRSGVERGSGSGVREGRWWRRSLESKVRRRRSLHHAVLIGAYVLTEKPRHVSDREYLFSERDRHLDTHTRYSVMMLGYLQLMFHFNTSLIRSEQWGEERNGTWVGIAGALRRGVADFGAPISVKTARLGVFEYSGLITEVIFPTVFRQPQWGSASLSAFTAPLAGAAWGAALSLSLLATVLLAFTALLESRYGGSYDNYSFSLGSMLLDFVNIFYLDASWRESRMWAGRATAFCACTLGLLLMQFYSASLLASVVAPPPKLINSLQDLLRTDMEYKVEDIVYHRQFFKEYMEIPEIKQLYRTKVMHGKIPPFLNNDEGLKLVKEGDFAFQITETSAYHEISRWSEELVCSVDELLVYPKVQLYFSVTRGSPYNQHFLVAMATVHERGVATRSRPRYYIPRPRCPPEHATAPRPVAITQFMPALHMLAILYVISVGVLVAELIMSMIINCNNRHVTL